MGSGSSGRVRVERGIYRQPNGKYAVCWRHAGRLRFRTVGFDAAGARRTATSSTATCYRRSGGGGSSPVQCCAPLGEPALTEEQAKELEVVFKALADRHRVKILNALLAAGGEAVCVCDFEELLGLKQPTVSYHLKELLTAGIVEREKRGSYAYLKLAEGSLASVCSLVGASAERAAAA